MAIEDVLAGREFRLSIEEMQAAGRAYQEEIMQARQAAGDENKSLGEQFLAKNKGADGVTELDSGLQYKVLAEGDGERPTLVEEEQRLEVAVLTERDLLHHVARGRRAEQNDGRELLAVPERQDRSRRREGAHVRAFRCLCDDVIESSALEDGGPGMARDPPMEGTARLDAAHFGPSEYADVAARSRGLVDRSLNITLPNNFLRQQAIAENGTRKATGNNQPTISTIWNS